MRIGDIRIREKGFLEEFDRIGKFFLFQLAVTGTSQGRSVVSVDLQSAIKIRGSFFQVALRNVYVAELRQRLVIIVIELDGPVETFQSLERLIVAFEL